ncbi:MAG TPA: MucB/RseB C-terminal domain-containing protein [Gammaproteobacteria bacterium]|nr:MucB/RseB C-terminal domain-containing protein [Gammaproteobacteria bacterium]
MRSRNAASAAIFCCALLVALPVSAADHSDQPVPVLDLLQRMNRALQTLDYKGTFVYLHEGELEAMHVVHRVDERGGEERLTSLTGPLREVVRRHKTVECILPRKQLVVVDEYHADSRFPMIMPAGSDAQELGKYYSLRRLGQQRTAGRECVVVAVQPKDQYRYGYRLWLDSKTNLLLRSELINAEGDTIERVMFTHIEMPQQIPPDAVRPTIDSSGFARRPRNGGSAPAAPGSGVAIEVATLPPGFALTVDESQHIGADGPPVRHLVFSDGLASLSVFAAPYTAGKDVLHGASQRGSVNAYGRVLEGYQVTVVGDVPAETVEMVAQSVRLAGEKTRAGERGAADGN